MIIDVDGVAHLIVANLTKRLADTIADLEVSRVHECPSGRFDQSVEFLEAEVRAIQTVLARCRAVMAAMNTKYDAMMAARS